MNPKEALKNWIDEAGMTAPQFAARLPYDRGNFHRLLNSSDVWPTLDLAFRIERETGGAVRMADWAQAKAA